MESGNVWSDITALIGRYRQLAGRSSLFNMATSAGHSQAAGADTARVDMERMERRIFNRVWVTFPLYARDYIPVARGSQRAQAADCVVQFSSFDGRDHRGPVLNMILHNVCQSSGCRADLMDALKVMAARGGDAVSRELDVTFDLLSGALIDARENAYRSMSR